MLNQIRELYSSEQNVNGEILYPSRALSDLSTINQKALRAIALTLAGLGIACGGDNGANINIDSGISPDNGITDGNTASDIYLAVHDADFAPSPDLDTDEGVNGSPDSSAVPRVCPDDEVAPTINANNNDCFENGCFNDVVRIATREEITALENSQRIVPIKPNATAILVGNSNVLKTSNIYGCTALAAFAHREDGQMVRGLTHLGVDGGSDGSDGVTGSGIIISELKEKMRRDGGALGKIYYYAFTGSYVEGAGQSLDYAEEYLNSENDENDCAIGFRNGVRNSSGELDSNGVDVYVIIATDGHPEILYIKRDN